MLEFKLTGARGTTWKLVGWRFFGCATQSLAQRNVHWRARRARERIRSAHVLAIEGTRESERFRRAHRDGFDRRLLPSSHELGTHAAVARGGRLVYNSTLGQGPPRRAGPSARPGT